jgi:hypothetical protein
LHDLRVSLKKNAIQATNSICLVHNDLALMLALVKDDLLAFVLDLNDKDRPGRPIEVDDSLLEKLFEQDRR